MSDDVKVKFSGDFSDIPKGADAAVKNAGSAMSGYFKDLGSSLIGSLGGMFAAGAVIGKVFEQFQAAGEYFKELIHVMHATGASAVELQKIGSMGKVLGIGFETIGKSLGLFSKYMGNASKDASGHGKVLRELGFGTDRITAGNITATEVLEALAQQLEETGNAYLVAANATAIFGRAGRELMPIIRLGKEEIKDQTKATKTFSEAEVQGIDASEREWGKFFKTVGSGFKGIYHAVVHDEGFGAAREAASSALGKGREREQAVGFEPNDERIQQSKEYREDLVKLLKSKGLGYEWMKEHMKESPTRTDQMQAPIGFENTMKRMEEEDNKKKAANALGSSGSAALASSSLQAIGGGDIASIYTGASIQQAQLDAANQTAANTGILAAGAKEPQKQSKPANVAK